jgi:23S rRNA (cytosine1962-C5)-methyltransferase
VLKSGRAKPVKRRHPWIFSGAVQRVEGDPQPGDIVDVVDKGNNWLAVAYFNPLSQIRARILSWEQGTRIDATWWHAQLQASLARRQALDLEPETNAFRLVNAEADGLPGLIVDKYGDYLVFQALTAGIDRRKVELVEALAALLEPKGIIERSDVDVRRKEGLAEVTAVAHGRSPQAPYYVRETGHRFEVDLLSGHKTGFYLDQRVNRALVGQSRFVAGREILNVFAYTGGFAVYAAAGGAGPVTNVDSSADMLAMAATNMHLNHGARQADEYITGDAFQVLRHFRDNGRQFDVVVLDPPKFAHSRGDVQAATRGYKDLNWLAFRLIRPGGLLATFSCSGQVSADLLQKVIFGAVIDAGRDAQILYHLAQSPDHPTLLTFPESAYLKGFLLRVL